MPINPVLARRVAYAACLAFTIDTAGLAQTPQVSPSPDPAGSEAASGLSATGLVLVSLVPKAVRMKCSIGTNNVVINDSEATGPGFSTGLIPWRPEKEPLRAVAKGYAGAELKPFLKPGQAPVVLIKGGTSGQLAFSVIPNTESRVGSFYDAINLTPDSSLQVKIDGKTINLPKGTRTRVSTNNKITFAAHKGTEDSADSGDFPAQYLMIFYRSEAGRTECVLVRDALLQ